MHLDDLGRNLPMCLVVHRNDGFLRQAVDEPSRIIEPERPRATAMLPLHGDIPIMRDERFGQRDPGRRMSVHVRRHEGNDSAVWCWLRLHHSLMKGE